MIILISGWKDNQARRGVNPVGTHLGDPRGGAGRREVVAAGECAILLSEDLQDGQDFDGVRVRNPFA